VTVAVDVRDAYLADFEEFTHNGARRAPAWLSAMRTQAIARFAERGFPSTRQEEWRFTNVAPIAERAFSRPAARSEIAAQDLASWTLGGEEAIQLVVVNGIYAPELSSRERPDGLRLGSLKSTLERDPAFAERHLGRYASIDASPFAALNTAFFSDGALIHVAPGTRIERPIELVFVTATLGASTALVTYPRVLIVLETGAKATVLEHYVTLTDEVYWTNAVSEVAVADAAELEYLRVQRESRQAFHIAATYARQGRDSMVRLHPFALGGALVRHDVQTVLDGSGAELVLNGFYLLRGRQHADHHTVIDHARPHGTSHEFFNGIVGEQAHGVFSGRIIVRPGAQRTDSKQTNNNLLLSAEARADSQPQLEIYADDVKCTHGSTVGPLDELGLYYLRSRGLSRQTAAAMLTYGLAAEILDRVRHERLRRGLEQTIRNRLAERSAGGRRAVVSR